MARPLRKLSTVTMTDFRCNLEGLKSLGSYAANVERGHGGPILVDCSLVKRVDANMAAALKAIEARAEINESVLLYDGVRPGVRDALRRNGFFTDARHNVSEELCIPLKSFALTEAKKFAEFTSHHFLRHQIPLMSLGVRDKFFEGIDELFNNAAIHSKARFPVYVCGQVFPSEKRLDFTIVDLGIGFRENVERYLNEEIGAAAAIAWGMERDNTTRAGDIPGGLGLSILREFVEKNGGELMIYSDKGYWSHSNRGVSAEGIDVRFPGTFVTLEIKLDDEKIYFLEDEIDPNSIL